MAAPGKIQEGVSYSRGLLEGVLGGEAVVAPVQHFLFHHLWNGNGLRWAQEIVLECLIHVISPVVPLKSALMLLAGKYL